jgi:chromosome segregation ATPase
MTFQEELEKLRAEARKLRQENAILTRTKDQHKEKGFTLVKKNSDLQKKVKDLKIEINRLNDFIAKLLNIKDNFAGMLFKTNLKKDNSKKTDTKKRGGQLGHIGSGRKKPVRIDQEKEIHLSHCPTCQASAWDSTPSFGLCFKNTNCAYP